MVSKKILFFLLGAVLVCGALGAVFMSKKRAPIPQLIREEVQVHYANTPSIPIKKIRIKAFYFLPSDRVSGIRPGTDGWRGMDDDVWRATIDSALARLKQFWEFQLHDAVAINIELYPRAIIGSGDHLFYGGANTGRGNPDGFRLIKAEILSRVFTPGGDLYDESFAKVSQDEYKVMGIFYEGDAAGASMLEIVSPQSEADTSDINVASLTGETAIVDETEFPAFFVARWYVGGDNKEDYGLSMLAHEFGHTLGLRDNYDLKTGDPLTDEIMGAGRFRPLDITYLGDEEKATLGFTY